MKFDVYGISDTGCVRELNEDSYCIRGFKDGEEPGFCVVADGMGGHNAGEVASALAVEKISGELGRILTSDGQGNRDLPRLINDSIDLANYEIYAMSKESAAQSGMGTTAVICVMAGAESYIANVGDSRVYACRNDEIYQVTVDHSVVEELVANGTITREEARYHPQKNIITRALGTESKTRADIFEYEYFPGDVILMCSDGLSGMVEDNRMKEIVGLGGNAEEIASSLCREAKNNGGSDNITVVCIRCLE